MSGIWEADVRKFNCEFNFLNNTEIKMPLPEIIETKRKLIKEEYNELIAAIDSNDVAQIAKESADLIYVILGNTLACGIEMLRVWNLVHISNMAKIKGTIDEHGKLQPPDDWIPPNIESCLLDQKTRKEELLEKNKLELERLAKSKELNEDARSNSEYVFRNPNVKKTKIKTRIELNIETGKLEEITEKI